MCALQIRKVRREEEGTAAGEEEEIGGATAFRRRGTPTAVRGRDPVLVVHQKTWIVNGHHFPAMINC